MSEHTSSNPEALAESKSDAIIGLGSVANTDNNRREELDDLIWKAQELVRNLDTLSVASEMTEEAPEAELTGEPTTLAELDRAIATSADREMQKNVAATVDAVLDQVFEERAAIVQKLDEPVASIVEDVIPTPQPRPVEAPAAPAVAAEAPASVVEAMPPPPASAAPTPAATAIVEMQAAPAPSTLSNTVEAKSTAIPPAIATPKKFVQPKISFTTQMAKLARPLVPVLVILNFPLRLVPASLRPVVDWAALSLLVWVPIIWIMVVMLGESSPDDASHGAAGDHVEHVESSTPASHGGH